FLALPAAAASYQDYLLSLPGLTSHWGMAETSGNTVADSVTNDLVDGNNPGSFALGGGASLNVAGPRPGNGFAGFSPTNSAIHFNGTAGQRLDMSPAGYTGPDGLATASMATWFRLTAPANNNEHNFLGGLQLEADGASDRYGLAMNSYPQSNPNSSNSGQRGGLRAFVRVGNNPQSNVSTYGTSYTSSSGDTSFWDSQWHFGVTTFDRYGSNGRVLKLYVDGGLVRRVSEGNLANLPDGPDTTLAARDALVFGQDAADSSRLWQGQLDEISMFSRSLTGAEVGNAYMAAKGITTNHALLPTRGLSAHRGQSTTHPENTIAALKAAVDAGAHQVEFDVQLTQDNKLILMHDTETIERTTGVAGRVQDFTLSQLKALDAGSWKDATFTGERIPTLEEALEVLPLNMWLNVEIKGVDGNEGATAAMAAAVLHAKGRLHQSFIAGSGGTRAAVAAYESQAGVDIRFNNLDREGGVTSAYVAATINHGDDFIQLRYNHPEATPQQIQALNDAGVQINYHFTNDPSRVSGLYDRGIDFVQADDVEMMMGAAIAEGVVPLLPLYRGDFNQDGQVDSRDFDPFFSALIDPSGFAADNPDFDVDIYGDFSLSGEFGLEDYEGFHLAVTGGATLAGDFNLDGKVDQDDYQVWKSAFGLAHATSLVPADANGDGVVDAADYTVWRNNLGASAPGALLAANSAAVPEPRGLVLVLLATAGFAFYAAAKRVELQRL
ncbi:MAG: hypothetical protein GX601_08165, partial [Anaerolineales bacterium]|nr:hypothetical protein [Anaerolineales bacterium]